MTSPTISGRKIAFIMQPVDVMFHDQTNLSSIPILTQKLAQRLAEEGNEVTIYSRRVRGQKVEERDEWGVRYRRVTNRRDEWTRRLYELYCRLRPKHFAKRPFYSSLWFRPRYIGDITRELRKNEYDLIHIHNFSQYVPLIRRAAPNSKIVLHMHCEWLAQLDEGLIAGRIAKSDLVLSCSDFVTGKTRVKFPQFADRCFTLFNGVDPQPNEYDGDAQTPPGGEGQERPLIVFVGRVSPEKGIHVLLAAFHKILTRYPDARLEIIGPRGAVDFDFVIGISEDPLVQALADYYQGTAYEQLLQGLINALPADSLSFIGQLSHGEALQHVQQAAVFAFPVIWDEPFGMPIVEAMVQEVPVVASRRGGIVDIVVEGETGLLVEANNAEELATAVIQLLGDKSLRQTMGAAGRQRAVNQFTWKTICDMLQGYYYSILPGEV